MTNGSVEIATGVLQKAGVDSLVDSVMDVAQCQAWKPAPTAYQYAVWSPGFKLQPTEVRAPAAGACTLPCQPRSGHLQPAEVWMLRRAPVLWSQSILVYRSLIVLQLVISACPVTAALDEPCVWPVRCCQQRMSEGSIHMAPGSWTAGRQPTRSLSVHNLRLFHSRQRCFLLPQVMLVAVHPWDINGAKAAGLQAAFVARNDERYPPFYKQPDLTVASLTDLADQLTH